MPPCARRRPAGTGSGGRPCPNTRHKGCRGRSAGRPASMGLTGSAKTGRDALAGPLQCQWKSCGIAFPGLVVLIFVSCHEYSEAMMRDQSDRDTLDIFGPRRGRPPKVRVLSDAERARRYRKKQARAGQVRVTVTIPAGRRDELLAFVAALQDET